MHDSRRFVVTGGPGSGKTALLSALAREGFAVLPEAGRAITRFHRAIDGPAGHGGDRLLFAELMLSWDMRSYAEAPRGISFSTGGCRIWSATLS
ncbi:MAG: AAA family ATPase [Rhizobiaceae bacterium]